MRKKRLRLNKTMSMMEGSSLFASLEVGSVLKKKEEKKQVAKDYNPPEVKKNRREDSNLLINQFDENDFNYDSDKEMDEPSMIKMDSNLSMPDSAGLKQKKKAFLNRTDSLNDPNLMSILQKSKILQTKHASMSFQHNSLAKIFNRSKIEIV